MTIPFEEFFEAVWSYPPYPWQVELSRQVREDGWPAILDIPTGCGKTAALDVALHHFMADGGRTAPRRILMIVDRRVIVDQVGTYAATILDALHNPEALGLEREAVLRRVRDELRKIVGPHGPLLHTEVLRGGKVRTDAWARYPHTPVLAGATVDQVGSRLFFRGYGVSRRMQAIHAGLLGCDTLLLLDEVHLARPFAAVLEQLIELRRRSPSTGHDPKFGFVQLSATPGRTTPEGGTDRLGHRVLRLTEADRRNDRLAAILGASKPARLTEVSVRGKDERPKRAALARAAAQHALEMLREGRRAVAVVVNRVDTARQTWALLEESEDSCDVVLITGRMRPLDQIGVVDRIRERVGAGRSADDDVRPLVVVATQTIEAGADYDFDGLVTEIAPLDALRQRFGRLDRRGDYASRAMRSGADLEGESGRPTARAVILGRSDQLKAGRDAVYGDRLAATWRWLSSIAVDGVVDFGIDALQPRLDELGEDLTQLTTEPRHVPVLLPAYLDQWVQTSDPPHADPDVTLFLHGIPDDARSALADVQVVWRSDITEEDLASAEHNQPRKLLIERVAMIPPGALEAISLPIHAVKQWLQGTAAVDDITDVEGVGVVVPEGGPPSRSVLRWRGASSSEVIDAREIAPGDLIVVPATYGGLGVHRTFDPDAKPPREGAPLEEGPLYDLGDAVQLLQRGSPTLRLDARVIGRLVGRSFGERLPDPEDDAADRRAALTAALVEIAEAAPAEPAWFREIIESLERPRFEALSGGGWIALGPRQDQHTWVAPDPLGGEEEEDESFTGSPEPELLEAHLSGVSDLAREFAIRAHLPPRVVESIGWAARLHDIGKVDPRFQVLLYGGDEISARFGETLAKSMIGWQSRAARRVARERAGYPRGQRHELVGLAMVANSTNLRERIESSGADWDLVLHLIGSHHGWCRPLAPVVHISRDSGEHVEYDCDGIRLDGTTAHGLDDLGSGVCERFWRLVRTYGWHELAYFEAILQLADHRHSAGDVQPRPVLEPAAAEV